MAMAQISRRSIRAAMFASQSWKWLMEGLAHMPQVRLVFRQELPQLADRKRNFVDP
jgi:hypothetical protein